MKTSRTADLSTAQEIRLLASGTASYVTTVAGAASVLHLSWKPAAFGAASYGLWLLVLVAWGATVEPRLKRNRPSGRPDISRASSRRLVGGDKNLDELQNAVRRILEEDAAARAATGSSSQAA